ncbi:MAG: hypothetical protein LPK45_05470, partial [Bacteroidota bacterium]|nr:hypothetical protein [Bacteroidota bacterium]MDX5430516.1 hypothetical protein [Bacteroidota bacterium]MDX5469269.1 hypothetical protein [Bacteroidota bacterium]
MKNLLLLTLAFFFSLSLFSQGKDYLVIHKPGKKKKYYYFIGDQIIIQPARNFPKITGTITGFGDSVIRLDYSDSILFSDIEAIVVNPNPRIFPKNMWLSNLVVSSGTIALWQVAYLV